MASRGDYRAVCAACGSVFDVRAHRGPRRQTCSAECLRRYRTRDALRRARDRRDADAPRVAECEICESTFTQTRSDAIYCSPLCRNRAFNARRAADGRLAALRAATADKRAKWQAENRHRYRGKYVEAKTCLVCGGEFRVRVSEPTQMCSAQCRSRARSTTASSLRARAEMVVRRAARGSRGSCVWTEGACAECGERFTSNQRSARYCSGRCASLAQIRRKRCDRDAFAPTRTFRMRIYVRDGWVCQLCGEPVDPSIDDHLSDWFPSLDHIVPRSQGGSNDASNLRLAHRWCNSVRGDESYYTAADLVA